MRKVQPAPNPQRAQQRKAPADPPTIAPIHQLIRAPLQPAQLRRPALQAREPPRERPQVHLRAAARGEERLQHHPRRERAERVPAVRLAQRGARRVQEERGGGGGRVVRLRGGGEAALVGLAARDEGGGAGDEGGGEEVEEVGDAEEAVDPAGGASGVQLRGWSPGSGDGDRGGRGWEDSPHVDFGVVRDEEGAVGLFEGHEELVQFFSGSVPAIRSVERFGAQRRVDERAHLSI